MCCLGNCFGGDAADADGHLVVERTGGVVGQVTVDVVAGIGRPLGVERRGCLIGHSGGLVGTEIVSVVVCPFAEQQKMAGFQCPFGGFAAHAAEHLADGHGVLFPRRKFVEHLFLRHYHDGHAVELAVKHGQPFGLFDIVVVAYNHIVGGSGSVDILVGKGCDAFRDKCIGIGEQDETACFVGGGEEGKTVRGFSDRVAYRLQGIGDVPYAHPLATARYDKL